MHVGPIRSRWNERASDSLGNAAAPQWAYHAIIAAGYSTPDLFPAELQVAFARWSQVANIHFQQTTNPAAANIKIVWAPLDGPLGILAETSYSISPSTSLFNSAQITFDDLEIYNPSSGAGLLAGGVAFEIIALHEIGHAR